MADEKNTVPEVEGAHVKKEGFMKKAMKAMIDIPDGVSMKDYIVFEKVIPGLKYVIVDTINLILFGQVSGNRGGNNGTRIRVSYDQNGNSRTNYNQMSRNQSSYDINFENIVVPDQQIAMEIINNAREIVSRVGQISIRDFYKVANLRDYPKNSSDTIYGWKNLDNAYPKRYGNEWEIVMPKICKL